MNRFGGVLALAALAGGVPAWSDVRASQAAAPAAARISTADFAALPALSRPSLSPDGRWIAARASLNGNAYVAIVDADRPEATPRMISLGEASLAALQWAGSQRLLLTVRSVQELPGRVEVPFLRLIALDTATQDSRIVDGKSRGVYAGDVLFSHPSGSWALVASQDHVFAWPSVKRVDLATGKATLVEKAREGVWDWYADDQGVVRLGLAIDGRNWTVWHRSSPEEKLRATRGKFPRDDDSAVDQFIFGKDGKSWVITNERTGRFGVYRYDLKTNSAGEAVYENSEVDIDEIVYDPETNEISGVHFEDDRRRTFWFDPERKALQAKLERALPNSVVRVVQASADRNRMLVWSGGGSDPGAYYLLDRAASRMHPVVAPYLRIDPLQLSEVKAVRYQTRDGLSIRAYLTLPRGREGRKLPLIVMPHGGPFMRDSWDYSPEVQFLANRGYAVLQPQFRGSTGFGKDFVARGYGEIGKRMQDDLDDGVDWLVRSGQVDAGRICIVGSSYGGYAAMWAAIRNPERYRCAASMAGVSDLPSQVRYDRKSFSATRYYREWRSKIAGEGKSDLAAVSPINFADRVKLPILIAHGEKDEKVPVKQSRQMVEALTKAKADVSSVFYKESGHGFDSSADFEDWLRRLEQFLAKHNPA